MSRERWEEIADEFGTYDLEYVGYAYVGGDELVRQEPPAVGQWMRSEEVCKRIAQLEAERAEMEALIGEAIEWLDGVCVDDGCEDVTPWPEGVAVRDRMLAVVAKHKEQA